VGSKARVLGEVVEGIFEAGLNVAEAFFESQQDAHEDLAGVDGIQDGLLDLLGALVEFPVADRKGSQPQSLRQESVLLDQFVNHRSQQTGQPVQRSNQAAGADTQLAFQTTERTP